MSPEAADQTLRAVTDWGRYAEAFAYDDQTECSAWRTPDFIKKHQKVTITSRTLAAIRCARLKGRAQAQAERH